MIFKIDMEHDRKVTEEFEIDGLSLKKWAHAGWIEKKELQRKFDANKL